MRLDWQKMRRGHEDSNVLQCDGREVLESGHGRRADATIISFSGPRAHFYWY